MDKATSAISISIRFSFDMATQPVIPFDFIPELQTPIAARLGERQKVQRGGIIAE